LLYILNDAFLLVSILLIRQGVSPKEKIFKHYRAKGCENNVRIEIPLKDFSFEQGENSNRLGPSSPKVNIIYFELMYCQHTI
jgi:hypothetical protein